MALNAKDPADRCEQLITLTERITTMVTRETDLLDARRTDEAMELQNDVIELADIYRRECSRIKADPGLISPAPPRRRSTLRTQTVALHQALDRHEMSLKAVKTLTEGLVRSVADFIADDRAELGGYSAQAGRSAATGTAKAITLNKRV